MSSNFKKILSPNKDIEQKKLLEYLNDELPADEQHDVESSLNDDPFASDAMDGLQAYQNKQGITDIVSQLNNDLKKQLAGKKKRKKKKEIASQPWVYYAIIFILLICIVSYFVIKRMGS